MANIYSNIGIGKSASQELFDSVGADLVITPLSFPLQMVQGHIRKGALFCVIIEEPPLFDDGYDPLLQRLMLMQRQGLSTQQSVLLMQIDSHVQLRQAMNIDLALAWSSLGGRVEYYDNLSKTVDVLKLTVPVLTAENQMLRSMPGFDARIATQMLADNDNRLILPMLVALEQNQEENGSYRGINREECRNFVGLTGQSYLVQGEYND